MLTSGANTERIELIYDQKTIWIRPVNLDTMKNKIQNIYNDNQKGWNDG